MSTPVQFGGVVGSILILSISAASSIIQTPSFNFVIGPHVTEPAACSHSMLALGVSIACPGRNVSWLLLIQMSHFGDFNGAWSRLFHRLL